MSDVLSLIGKTVGRIKILSTSRASRHSVRKYHCTCLECGEVFSITRNSLLDRMKNDQNKPCPACSRSMTFETSDTHNNDMVTLGNQVDRLLWRMI